MAYRGSEEIVINGTRRATARTVLLAFALALTASNAVAQELEPGAYQNVPVGVNVFIAGYGYSTGNVLVDAALPIEGAKAQIHGLALGYLRTIDVFGRAGKFDVVLPLSTAHFEGVVAGEFRTRDPKGLADPRVRLSVNFLGSPALDLPDFVRYRQRTIVGASIQVAVPIGQYDGERLINLGANRWAIRPELGISQSYRRWVFEGGAGVWLFTDNDDYFGGSTLAQRSLYFVKGSAIYSFRRNLWASFSYGHATGGETELDGVFRNDLQKNDRIAATLATPAGRIGSLRFAYTSGLTTRLGADFDSVSISYQYSWGPKAARK
jgi:hypothetical protein